MSRLATIVDVGALLKVIAVSFVACIVLAIGLGYAIVGITRSSEHRRDGRDGTATAYGALGLTGVLVVAAAVALGLIVMIKK